MERQLQAEVPCNHLLGALSPADLALLRPHLKPVPLKFRQWLQTANRVVKAKAAEYMLQAGDDAFWRDAKTEAVRYLARGLEAVSKSNNAEGSALSALKLRLELRNPLFQLARMEELGEHLKAARPLAARLSDPVHTGRYLIFQSHYDWFAGNSDGALEEANAAQLLARSKGLPALALRAQFQRGLVHFSCGRYRDAIAYMNKVTATITSHETQNAFGLNRSLLVTTLRTARGRTLTWAN